MQKSYIIMDANVVKGIAQDNIRQIKEAWAQKKLDAVAAMRKSKLRRFFYYWTSDEEYLESQLEGGGFTALSMFECFQVEPRLDTARKFIRACDLTLANGDGVIHMTVDDLAQLQFKL